MKEIDDLGERLNDLENKFNRVSDGLDLILPIMGGAILVILWKIFL
jgi:archaellum component FlaC